jgi:hypothetical protein
MSGHVYENLTPYAWVWQMRARIGGTVLTVPDFVHGSVGHVAECGQHLVAYFETGRPDNGTCPGVQPDPESAAKTTAAASPGAGQAAQPLVYNPAKRYSLSDAVR